MKGKILKKISKPFTRKDKTQGTLYKFLVELEDGKRRSYSCFSTQGANLNEGDTTPEFEEKVTDGNDIDVETGQPVKYYQMILPSGGSKGYRSYGKSAEELLSIETQVAVKGVIDLLIGGQVAVVPKNLITKTISWMDAKLSGGLVHSQPGEVSSQTDEPRTKATPGQLFWQKALKLKGWTRLSITTEIAKYWTEVLSPSDIDKETNEELLAQWYEHLEQLTQQRGGV